MNQTERTMRDLLLKGKEAYGVVSVKAEFEAEGTRMDELLRLLDIARTAGLPVAVKIGGCEALRDLHEARQIGVQYVVAPMVETPYALSKFIAAKNTVYPADEQLDTGFLFNMETIAGFGNRGELIAEAKRDSGVQGVVFGRSDFVGSLGRPGDAINDDDVTEMITDVAGQCRTSGLDLVVGGGVSIDALPALRSIAGVHLSRFETRKVIFGSDALNAANIEKGLLNAAHFEVLWLLNKRDYYARITQEDAKRIDTLERRWRVLGTPV